MQDWKCAYFNTCGYEEDFQLGERHFKPQLVGGNEKSARSCPCGDRPHEPVVGKERSSKPAAYPKAFCRAYADLAIDHFFKMGKAEFLEGRFKQHRPLEASSQGLLGNKE